MGLYGVTDGAGIVAPIAASVGYAGANAFLLFNNNGTNVVVIPENSIVVSADQIFEATVQIYSGTEPPTRIYRRYQRSDANLSIAVIMREITLKPGERCVIRVFNRAPAAACNIAFGYSYFAIEQRFFDQIISRTREKFEGEVK